MDQFAARPSKLRLVRGEHFPTDRDCDDDIEGDKMYEVGDVTEMGTLVHSMQEAFVAK